MALCDGAVRWRCATALCDGAAWGCGTTSDTSINSGPGADGGVNGGATDRRRGRRRGELRNPQSQRTGVAA